MAVYKLKGKKGEESEEAGGHEARRSRTRQALIDASLDLMEEDRTFSSLSLREIGRAHV